MPVPALKSSNITITLISSKGSLAMQKEFDKYQIEKIKIRNCLIYKKVGYDSGIYTNSK